MFPQFGATANTLSKASTMVFRIGTDAHLYDDPEDVNIAPLLDSKYDSEKCEALKRLLALIAQGFDVSNFFPQVVKNVASQSLEVKKLVYLYLLHYAEKRPNEALLSINYFQKDLSDSNPLVRAWALRAMAGIRLHVISPLVLVAVGKCARDPSVYVRKCAANALPKLYDLHQDENASAIEEIVGLLLSDHSPGVVGAAAAAFNCVCPDNLSLVGRYYKKLCETLPDVEEWGQIILIGILLRYVIARHGLVRESILFSSNYIGSSHSEKDDSDVHSAYGKEVGDAVAREYGSDLVNLIARCYIEGPDEYLSRSSYLNKGASGQDYASLTSGKYSDDVKILLQCTSPLLWSQNSAVVLAAVGIHWIIASREDLKKIAKPLLFVLRSSHASKYVVLCNIQVFAKVMPSLFALHCEDFFICASDSYQIKALKLEILSNIATDSSISSIFKEFQDYLKDPDRRFVADTVAAIGLCAQKLPIVTNACLEGLLVLTKQETLLGDLSLMDEEAGVLAQAVKSIKAIIEKDPSRYEKVIIQLARSLDSINVPAARAMIIWMVGEYNSIGQMIPKSLTTILRYLASCFTSEPVEVKHQIINTAVKVMLSAQKEELWTFKRILCYLLQVAKFDINYDVRDRARILKKLLSYHIDPESSEEGSPCLPQKKELLCVISEFLLMGKTKPTSPEVNNFRFYLPGSLSQIVLHAAPGYEPLPKPCSFLYSDHSQSLDMVEGLKMSGEESRSSDSFGTNDPDTLSGSLNEESASIYSSRHSFSGSDNNGDAGSGIEVDDDTGPLIQLSDVGISYNKQKGSDETSPTSFADDLGGLMSKRALESWLDDQPGLTDLSLSKQSSGQTSSARISLRDVKGSIKRKSYTLLDPANGNGLRVDYSFSSEVSSISPLLVCVEISFQNSSTEPLTNISLMNDESNQVPDSTGQGEDSQESSLTAQYLPTIVPVEEISSLAPGQTIKRTLQVHFHHHLLPIELDLWCTGKKHPVKLRPDIGYFVKPLPMDVEDFKKRESQLPGMFEYSRTCNFTDHIEELNKETDNSSPMKDKLLVICQSLASKILSHANVFLVSIDMPVAANLDDASGLCLRFSCEILSKSIPCLITVTIEGKFHEPLNARVKVNCEETVFGLNLLNRVVTFLS